MDDYKKATIESYNQNSRAFAEKFKKLMVFSRRPEFDQFISLLPGKKIIDLGSGGGDHALYFKSKGLDVVCSDVSPAMIELCRAKDLDSCLMDIEHLPFANESFDGIWSVASLLHIPKANLPWVIEKLHAMLREGGILYAGMKQRKENEISEGIVPDENNTETKRFFAYWTDEELRPLLENHFECLEFNNPKVGRRVFLQYFLRKKPHSIE